ncbi:MAG: transposase [Saprospiraceae bacterium]|jgi:transposase
MTKSKISKFFVRYLNNAKTVRKLSVPLWRIVKAILYKLKTGIQWKHLPMHQFFRFTKYSWQSVYYHFNKWSHSGAWQQCYMSLVKDHKGKLDMSLVNFDGSHTPAKRGGEGVGYQGRKKAKTSNMLILANKQGEPLGWSLPISGEHHDSYNLKEKASDIFKQMEAMDLNLDGLFLNADAGFDVKDFRELCESKNIFHNKDFNKRRTKFSADTVYLLDNEL